MSLAVLLPCVTQGCDSACCDAHEVPLLESDVARLAAATGRAPREFVEDAEDWRLLKGAGVADDGCVFMGEVEVDGRTFRGCTVHTARPEACRTYPFVLGGGRAGVPVVTGDTFCPHVARFPVPDQIDRRLASLWVALKAERTVRRFEAPAEPKEVSAG